MAQLSKLSLICLLSSSAASRYGIVFLPTVYRLPYHVHSKKLFLSSLFSCCFFLISVIWFVVFFCLFFISSLSVVLLHIYFTLAPLPVLASASQCRCVPASFISLFFFFFFWQLYTKLVYKLTSYMYNFLLSLVRLKKFFKKIEIKTVQWESASMQLLRLDSACSSLLIVVHSVGRVKR